MTITIAGFFTLLGISLTIYYIGGGQDSSMPIKLRAILSVSSLALFLGLSAAVAFGYPQYKVWEQSKDGEAALAKATQDRQIKVQISIHAPMKGATVFKLTQSSPAFLSSILRTERKTI